MIRRVIVGLFLIYLSLWFGVAYIIEHEIKKFSSAGLSFSNIEISGFPRAWKFDITDPVVLIQSSKDPQSFSSKLASMTVSLGLKTIKFKISGPILVEFTSEEDPGIFQIDFGFPATCVLKFSHPIIFAASNLLKNISEIIFRNDNLYVSSDEDEIFVIEDAALYLKYLDLPDSNLVNIEANFSYNGEEEVLGFNAMKFAANMQVESSPSRESEKIHLKKIEIDNIDIIINEESYLGVMGGLNLPKGDLPQGKLELELQNYPALIDYLWPQGFQMTPKDAKSLISEAAIDNEDMEVKLSVVFSDSGIAINGKNLKDLKEIE